MAERAVSRRRGPFDLEVGSPLSSLQRHVNELFDDFFRGWPLERWEGFRGGELGFTPTINVTDSPKEVRITAELPGIDEKDVEITVTADSLTLRGEKHEEKEEKDESFYRLERSFGKFERVVPLPTEVNPDKAAATYSKGVLTITLPKVEESARSAKKIPIKAK